jgi:predicted DCC family thiol-disulfide oxidoreductase YuxK
MNIRGRCNASPLYPARVMLSGQKFTGNPAPPQAPESAPLPGGTITAMEPSPTPPPPPTPARVFDESTLRPAPPGSLPGSPVILFDGLCNLCNSAVAWIVDHDRRDRGRGRFRFASLQSAIARELLSKAGAAQGGATSDGKPSPLPLSRRERGEEQNAAVPDSIVLIDEQGGMHVRSDAAIRIARGLGFPWSLAAVFTIVPRPLRDWLYRLVARNRYRWYGRRESCRVPTAAERARFLDADEPPASRGESAADAIDLPLAGVLEQASRPRAVSLVERSEPGLAWSFIIRLVLCYILVYLLPFPMGTIFGGFGIEWIDWPAMQYGAWKREAVVWTAKAVFGLEITVFPAGSGDTTYNYVELFVFAIAAIIGAAAWTAGAGAWNWIRARLGHSVRGRRRGDSRAQGVSPRTFDLFSVYVRYYLAAVMLGYGINKVLLMQMPHPGPSRLMVTYGESSPFGLLWTSMGASPGYQFFGGLAETVGALLLFWRRTSLLGALVCAAALVNVVALNLFYDVPVKLFSSHLLLLSLFLAAPHLGRLVGVLALNLPTAAATLRPFPFRWRIIRWSALALKTAVVLWLTVGTTWRMMSMIAQMRPPAATNPLAGFYRVESFTIDGVADRALDDAARWVRVGIDDGMTTQAGLAAGAAVRCADGHIERWWLQLNLAANTITIPQANQQEPATLTYATPEAETDVVALEGTWGGKPFAARLRRVDAEDQLTTRGFRWVNEFPFYR